MNPSSIFHVHEQAQGLAHWLPPAIVEAVLLGIGCGAMAGILLGIGAARRAARGNVLALAGPVAEPIAEPEPPGAALDTRIWTRPITCTQLRLPSVSRRQLRVIAVCNLKGGVGKTTITANLAATLARGGKRVLVIDLDHQQSLTSLCLTHTQTIETRKSQIAVHHMLEEDALQRDLLHQIAKRVRGAEDNFAVVPAHHDLADKEDHTMIQWLSSSKQQRDVRFCLTAALNGSRLKDWADYILLDCPPRLTTASVNGLAASDFILAPILPDAVSAEAVPFFVRRLESLSEVLPHEGLRKRLGLVVNRCEHGPDQAGTFWAHSIMSCSPAWQPFIHGFCTAIPERVAFRDAAAASAGPSRMFAIDQNPELARRFQSLAAEIEALLHENHARCS